MIFLPGEAEAVDWQHYADARAKSVVELINYLSTDTWTGDIS